MELGVGLLILVAVQVVCGGLPRTGRDKIYGDSVHSRIHAGEHKTNIIIESTISLIEGSERSGIFYSHNITLRGCSHVTVVNAGDLVLEDKDHIYVFGRHIHKLESEHEFYLREIRELWEEIKRLSTEAFQASEALASLHRAEEEYGRK